jgi:hypothetical protein
LTAADLHSACLSEVSDDYYVNKAKCRNFEERSKREECLSAAGEARAEERNLCAEKRKGRLKACKSLGEGRYDPPFDPALFDNPKSPNKPNPYYPLTVGNRWEYRGGIEFNTIEVLNESKLIGGVRCIIVRDQVFKNGDLAENTDDWFCPKKDGAVWYFGEEVKDFETYDGDDPRRPELVSVDGSFKNFRDGDKGGIIFPATPKAGEVYLEEFSLGNAEDIAEVLSVTYRFGANPELDRLAPQKLVSLLCSAGDCVVTKNASLLEPGIYAYKYYARGIGFFLEIKPDTGETLQLTSCNFESRCKTLPAD